MAARAVRVVLVYDQEPASEPYTFDVMLDDAGHVTDADAVYGACADYPAMLRPDGIIDFGPALAEGRHYRTDLRTLALRPGTQVVVRDAAGSAWVYRVERIEPKA